MAEEPRDRTIDVYVDVLSNQPRNDQSRENFRRILRERFEARLSAAVERIWDLPRLIVRGPSGLHTDLLIEARELFIAGHFYSCVAMCGIVGERLVKDALRASVLVEKEGKAERPKDEVFDQLERVEINGLIRFLKEAGLLSDGAAKAAEELGRLRNSYAHARGRNSPKDAIEAVTQLHVLVEDTVSMFKDFEIRDGAFVPKKQTVGDSALR